MIALVFLWVVMALYMNMVRYMDLHDLTYVHSLKDYFKYRGGTTIRFNVTLFIILIGVISVSHSFL